MSFRMRVEHSSVAWVERLNRLPKWLVFLLVLACFAVGAFLPYGGILILVIAAFIAWLLFLTWPRLTPPERMLRFAILVLVVVIGIVRVFPR